MTHGSAAEFGRLGFDVGAWLADAAVAVLAEAGIPRAEVRAIGSHGQTIWHEAPHSTWQIGEAAVIAERTGVDVVSDFRVRDVAAGGQGAPLVPIADALLFSGEGWRALQNIGGIGNVTIVPPNGAVDGVRAFDTGPGVAVIDAVTRALVPGASYDVDGRSAARGHADHRGDRRAARASVLRRRAAEEHGARAVRSRVRRSLDHAVSRSAPRLFD